MLAARAPAAAGDYADQAPGVAIRGALLVYADGVTPALRRFRIGGAAPAAEALSLATGGDIDLHPRANLGGVRFGAPHGLAFGPDGKLYLADFERNAVYAIAPDSGGEIGPTSAVSLVIGDGDAQVLPPLGVASPGERFSVRAPVGLSLSSANELHVHTATGVVTYDLSAKEARWLYFVGGVDEIRLLTLGPAPGSLVALSPTSFLVTKTDGLVGVYRVDVDRLSSEYEPLRTMARDGSGFVLTDAAQDRTSRYDAAGRLVEVKRRSGERLLAYEYADTRSDRLARMLDARGEATTFAYASGKLTAITDPRGRVTRLTIDGLGDLRAIEEPDGATTTFEYAQHRMVKKTSPKGDVTTYTYAADGTLASSTKPAGETYTYSPALTQPSSKQNGFIVRRGSYVDPRGVTHDYTINERNQVEVETTVADGVTRVWRKKYAADVDHLAADPRRNRIFATETELVNDVRLRPVVTYDAKGRPIGMVRALSGGLDHAWTWRDDDRLGAHTFNSGTVETYAYDAAGRLAATAVTSAQPGPTTTWTYRADGQLDAATSVGVTTTFRYDATDQLVGWSDTLGRNVTLTRDLYGNVASRDDGQAKSFFGYDVMNRLLTARDALGNVTTLGYGLPGCGCTELDLVTSVHTPDLAPGEEWRLAYGPEGRVTSITDPHGFTERYEYEPTGELKAVTDRLGRVTTTTHDQLGRALATLDALGRRRGLTYPVPTTNPAFTDAGTLVGAALVAASPDATPASTSRGGTLRSGEYQVGKDDFDTEGYPARTELYRDATLTLALSRRFDNHGRLVERKDSRFVAGSNYRFEFAQYDERTTASVPTFLDSAAPSFYTAGSDAASIARNAELFSTQVKGLQRNYAQAQYDLTRDAGQRVIARATTFTRDFAAGGTSFAGPPATYEYAPTGYLSRVVNVDGTHTYTYDSRGLLAKQTIGGEGDYLYTYDVLGRLATLTFPDGHVRRQSYDSQGRMIQRCYEYSGGGATRCYTAMHDAVGNVVRMTDPEGTDVFVVDALDRLTSHTRQTAGQPDVVATYTYNALGALKTHAGIAVDDERPRLDGAGTAAAGIAASVGGQPVDLDVDGKVTSLSGTTLRWSSRAQLVEAQPPVPAPLETYGHDGYLRRISRTAGAVEEFYVYEGDNRIGVVHEGAAGAVVVDETVLFAGVDDALRLKRGSQVVYFETDLAGNVRRLRAPGGGDLGGYRYSAFGKTLEDTATVTQSLRWKGRWYSQVAGGIYDVRARQWSPQLGSFLTIDEFAYHDPKTTLWGWPGQNPVRYADPAGRGGWLDAFAASPSVAVLGLAAAAVWVNQVVADPGTRAALNSALADAARYSGPQGPAVFALATQLANLHQPPALEMAEHSKNARPSTEQKHEEGQARKKRDKDGEKGDKRRPYRRGNGKKKKGGGFAPDDDDEEDEAGDVCE